MPFIRQVHLEEPSTGSEHITHVRHSATRAGRLEQSTRESIIAAIERGATFYSHHERTHHEALVVVRTNAQQLRYLTTVADRRETNNLLALARF